MQEPLADFAVLARRVWLERGIVMLKPEQVRDEWDRRRIEEIATQLYGARKP